MPAASWEENRALSSKYECCTFRGSVTAYRIKDGMELWKSWAIPETPRATGKTKDGVTTWGPAGAGIWSAPSIDEKRRYYMSAQATITPRFPASNLPSTVTRY